MRSDFFTTEAFYSPREKIAHVQKIAAIGANFSRANNGGAIFSQMVIVNKSPGGEFFMLGVHEKIAPFLLGAIFSRGRKSHVTPARFLKRAGVPILKLCPLVLSSPTMDLGFWVSKNVSLPTQLTKCKTSIFSTL